MNAGAEKRILILGGGFAGAYAALQLEKRLGRAAGVEVVLVSRENFVLFTPMLHEVAGADVAVTDIVQPLRKMLRHTRVAIADVEAIDLREAAGAHPARRFADALRSDLRPARPGARRGDELLSHSRSGRACSDDENPGRRHPPAQPSDRRAGIGRQPGGARRRSRRR